MSSSPFLAHHFDDLPQQRDAATLGMWMFLGTEVLFFGGLFTIYTVYRFTYPQGFAEGSLHLDLISGTANTGILLTSSLTMALSISAIERNRRQNAVWLMLATILLGCIFLAIKGHEYWTKFEHHLVPGESFRLEHTILPDVSPRQVEMFYSLYFAMTALHALHMLIGVIVVGVLAVMCYRGRFSSAYFTPVEMTGLYWHFVDIIWVFLFPLLYLVDVHR